MSSSSSKDVLIYVSIIYDLIVTFRDLNRELALNSPLVFSHIDLATNFGGRFKDHSVATTNQIMSGSTLDIAPFYLARQPAGSSAVAQAGPHGGVQTNAELPPEIVVIGNPSAGTPFDWLNARFLPGIQVPPIADISLWPGYAPLTMAWNTNLNNATQHMRQRQEIVRQRLAAKLDSDAVVVTFKDSFGNVRSIAINFGDLKRMYAAFTYNVVFNMKLNPGYGGFTTQAADGS